jgi:hypothetical protein
LEGVLAILEVTKFLFRSIVPAQKVDADSELISDWKGSMLKMRSECGPHSEYRLLNAIAFSHKPLKTRARKKHYHLGLQKNASATHCCLAYSLP